MINLIYGIYIVIRRLNKIQRFERQILLNPIKHRTNKIKQRNKRKIKGKPNYKENCFDTLYYWAREIRMKYDYKCVICGAKRYLEAHHLLYKSKYPALKYSLNNGILLCHKCHDELHQLNDYNNKIVEEEQEEVLTNNNVTNTNQLLS